MDSDNAMTVFNWTGQQNDKNIDYVFGVEQPRLAINEAYVSFDNDVKDTGLTPMAGQQKAATYFRMNIFFEVLNPTAANPVNLAAYRVLVAKTTVGAAAVPAVSGIDTGTISATGMPSSLYTDDLGNPIVVSNWNPQALAANANSFSGSGFPARRAAGHHRSQGSVVQDNFIPSLDPSSPAGMLPKRRPSLIPDYQEPLLSIKVQDDPNTKKPTGNPTLVLQRLADPTKAFSDVMGPAYNPWITVDYFENIWTNDSYVTDGNGDVNPAPGAHNTLVAYGRKHPMKASQPLPTPQPAGTPPAVPAGLAITAQNPTPTPTDPQMPKTTFRRHNGMDATDSSATITLPFDWYQHLDRPMVNRGELLAVSTTSPVLLTHKWQAVGMSSATQAQRHRHDNEPARPVCRSMGFRRGPSTQPDLLRDGRRHRGPGAATTFTYNFGELRRPHFRRNGDQTLGWTPG